MNRRNFLSLLGASMAGIALDQAIPFNRVWSFPKEIVLSNSIPVELLAGLEKNFRLHELNWIDLQSFPPRIGTTIRLRMPQRFIVKESLLEVPFVPPHKYETAIIVANNHLKKTCIVEVATPAFPPEPSRLSSS